MQIKVTRMSVAIIDVRPEWYPEGVTEEDMLEYDKGRITEDPSIMDDWLRDDEITVERID